MKRLGLIAIIAIAVALTTASLALFMSSFTPEPPQQSAPALENSSGGSSVIVDATEGEGVKKPNDSNTPVVSAAGRLAKFGNATVNLTNNPNDSVYGQVAAAGDSVYVVWQESVIGNSQRNYDIFFNKSEDRGRTFEGKTANLSNNPGFSEHPQLVASGDGNSSRIYVVWADNTSGSRQVLFSKSVDGGNNFLEDVIPLSDSGVSAYNQEIAAFGKNVYVVWQQESKGENTIVMRASTDGGETFGGPVIMASGENIDPGSFPKVAAFGDSVHVAWSVVSAESGSGGNEERSGQQRLLLYSKSSDNGGTFSSAVKLNGDFADAGEAQLVVYQNDVHVIWGGLNAPASVPVESNLYHVQSHDGGSSFTGPKSVNSGSGLADPLNVELAIIDVVPAGPEAGQQDAYSGGGQEKEGKSYSLLVAAQTMVSASNDEIILLAGERENSIAGTAANLSNNRGISECPSISVSGNDVYVIWEDLTPGNHEILFARGSLA